MKNQLPKRSPLQVLRQVLGKVLGVVTIPTLLSTFTIPFASPALAGTITVENPFRPASSRQTSSSITGLNRALFCQYTPTGTSILGPNSFLTLIEVQGNSIFRYERTDATLVAGLPPADTSRSLTFFNTSADQARRQLASRPNDYANLLGLAPTDRVVRAGFDRIDRQFRCQPYDDVVATAQQPERIDSRQYSSIAALPDGNYRVTSVPQALEGDASQNAALFTFRKLGSSVTGNFAYPGNDLDACVTGTVEGNTVTGQAFTRDTGTSVLGQTYLGTGLALRLGDAGIGDRYDNAILDLNGFTRINAGTRIPPAVCP